MQDFQPIPGLAGRIFSPGSEAPARRLRNYPSTDQQQQQPGPQPPPQVKCPRCDSTNTKFCYYNNYNLSQPRHFCKSCRRYWTKGGVLRNVPVGGGCRKNSKRSSSSASSKSKPDKDRKRPCASGAGGGSSSESSSNPNADPLPEDPPLFADSAAGSFTSLMGCADPVGEGGFSFSDPGLLTGFRVSNLGSEEKVGDISQQPDPATDPGLQGEKRDDDHVDLNGLDWTGTGGSGVDSGSLFDITSSMDLAAYWNPAPWGDAGADLSLYLP